MTSITHNLKGIVWVYERDRPWYFVKIKGDCLVKIKKDVLYFGGFKSIKVDVKIGKTKWNTSIFPDG